MALPDTNKVPDLHIMTQDEDTRKKTHPYAFLGRARSQASSEGCSEVSDCKNTKSLINFMILQWEYHR